jgi:hypothetical protein
MRVRGVGVLVVVASVLKPAAVTTEVEAVPVKDVKRGLTHALTSARVTRWLPPPRLTWYWH